MVAAILATSFAPMAAITALGVAPFFSTRRVGGIRFIRVGRLNVSVSVSRRVESI